MQIIKDKNNIVVFQGNNFKLTEKGFSCPDFVAPWCRPTEYTLEKVDSVPSDYRGNHYTYDGEWVKTQFGIDQDSKKEVKEKTPIEIVKEELQTIEEEYEGKPLSMAYINKKFEVVKKALNL